MAIDQLMRLPEDSKPGARILYISPLKALVYDIERNLRAPIVGIARQAECYAETFRNIRVDMRTGDTSPKERRQQLRNPADILVTTPESLFLILGARGASFTLEFAAATREGVREIETALQSLLWAGQITNDTFFPLRNLGKKNRRRRPPKVSYSGGGWSLVESLVDPNVSATERAHARVTMLLQRYGIVSRSAALFEDLPGGYRMLYPLLREMEERGRLRRGHFVENLSGSQFALPGAVERLRAVRDALRPEPSRPDDEMRAYLAVDPANPYGSILPWPQPMTGKRARPRRVPGAWVVLYKGSLVLYMDKGGRTLWTFGELDEPEMARAAFRTLPICRAAVRGGCGSTPSTTMPRRRDPTKHSCASSDFSATSRRWSTHTHLWHPRASFHSSSKTYRTK